MFELTKHAKGENLENHENLSNMILIMIIKILIEENSPTG